MNKKKLIIIISAVAAGLVLIGALAAYLVSIFKSGGNGGDPVISVGSVSAEAGKNIRVPVSFKSNPGAMGFLLEFEYDTEMLEFISAENGELLTDCEATADDSGAVKLISVENEDIKRDGVLAYLNFKVKAEASGKTEIKLICGENSICNYDEEIISVKTENGTVTLK